MLHVHSIHHRACIRRAMYNVGDEIVLAIDSEVPYIYIHVHPDSIPLFLLHRSILSNSRLMADASFFWPSGKKSRVKSAKFNYSSTVMRLACMDALT